MPVGFGTLGKYPNVTAAMERRGWAETRIRKVHGENWLRVLGEVSGNWRQASWRRRFRQWQWTCFAAE